MIIKKIMLRFVLIFFLSFVMSACGSMPNSISETDYADELETPDILLQETNKKSKAKPVQKIQLDPEANKNNQQVKKDPLLKALDKKNIPVNKVKKQEVEVIKQKLEPKPDKKDSDKDIEVADPLLDEVDNK